MPTTTLTRSLLVIILPSMFAFAPWLFFILSQVPTESVFYGKYPLLINAFLFAFVVVVGCAFEGLNTHFETKWDKERETEYVVDKNWYDYLALVCSAEPVGFKYIARTVTVMYFELAMVWAFTVFGVGVIGILWLFFAYSMPFVGGSLIALLIAATLSCCFWKQAKHSHKVLCRCRKELNARLYAPRQAPFLSGCFS